MKQTIMVIGGTGRFGEPVARQLLNDDFNVRIFTRNPEKAGNHLGDKFEFIKGDVESMNILEQSLDGCFGVHINLRGSIEYIGTANVAKAAAKTGVQRLSYLSGSRTFEENAWFPTTTGKLLAESAIKKCGVPYSIFCATNFMESLPLLISGKKAMIPGNQPHRLHWLAAKDYAKLVSKAFQSQEAANKRFFIFGPESLTMFEALGKYIAVVRPDVKVRSFPGWLMWLVSKISFNTGLQIWVRSMQFLEKVGEGGDPTEANNILGSPQTTLEQWCTDQII